MDPERKKTKNVQPPIGHTLPAPLTKSLGRTSRPSGLGHRLAAPGRGHLAIAHGTRPASRVAEWAARLFLLLGGYPFWGVELSGETHAFVWVPQLKTPLTSLLLFSFWVELSGETKTKPYVRREPKCGPKNCSGGFSLFRHPPTAYNHDSRRASGLGGTQGAACGAESLVCHGSMLDMGGSSLVNLESDPPKWRNVGPFGVPSRQPIL